MASIELSALTVFECPFPILRLGKMYDGGYVIADIPNIIYKTFLTGGIDGDSSFEEAFINKYPDVKCFAFDGTINHMPLENSSITFIKKNIGAENNDTVTNLHEYINNNSSIFVKMDIEGGEIPWINSLSEDQVNKFEQIVIEFHFPYTESEIEVFKKINKNHVLIHFHGNNGAELRIHKGVVVPDVFECTYVHKKYFQSRLKLNTTPIPSFIDMENCPPRGDHILNYPPFVHQGLINTSQASQDLFVMKVLNYKLNGTFIDIGSSNYQTISNSYTLEKQLGWRGVLVEINPFHLDSYKTNRNLSYPVIDDATNVNFTIVLNCASMPQNIDYLQIDIGASEGDLGRCSNLECVNTRCCACGSIKVLENFETQVFDHYKFAVITFEHNKYLLDQSNDIADKSSINNTILRSREIFKSRGYFRVFTDVKSCGNPFEDWYVHPDLVDMEYIKKITRDESLEHTDIINIMDTY